MKRLLKNYQLDLLCIFTLFFSAWKFTYGIENFLDVPVGGDEFNYINNAYSPSLHYAPLYSYYYLALSYFNPSRAILFYLNYKITFALIPVLFYLLLRRCKISILISLLASFYIMFNSINIGIDLRVNYFAFILILISLYFSSFIKKNYQFYLFLSLSALIVSYVRPEFILTSALLLAMSFYVLVYKKEFIIADVKGGGENQNHLTRKDLVFCLSIFSLAIFMVYLMGGIPIGGGRSFIAFSHHFSMNWITWTSNNELNSWADRNLIIRKNFGEVNSMIDCIIAEPNLFFKHIFSNIINFPRKLGNALVLGTSFLLPVTFFTLEGILNAIILIFGAFFLVLKNFNFKEILYNIKNERVIVSSIFYMIPTLISVILIFPREHYLTTINYLISLNFVILLFRKITNTMNQNYIIVCCFLFIFFSPSIHSSFFARKKQSLDNKNMLLFLEKLNVNTKKFNYLDPLSLDFVFKYYYINTIIDKKKLDKSRLENFIRKESIHLIIIEKNSTSYKELEKNEQWENFFKNYEKIGFRKMPIPNTNRIVFLHNSIF